MEKDLTKTYFENKQILDRCKAEFTAFINTYNEQGVEGVRGYTQTRLFSYSKNEEKVIISHEEGQKIVNFIVLCFTLFTKHDELIKDLIDSTAHIILIAKDFLDNEQRLYFHTIKKHELEENLKLFDNLDAKELKKINNNIEQYNTNAEKNGHKTLDNIYNVTRMLFDRTNELLQETNNKLDDIQKDAYTLEKLFMDADKETASDREIFLNSIMQVYINDATASTYKTVIEYIKKYFDITLKIKYKANFKSYVQDRNDTIYNLFYYFDKNIDDKKDTQAYKEMLNSDLYINYKGLVKYENYKKLTYADIDKYKIFDNEQPNADKIIEYNKKELNKDISNSKLEITVNLMLKDLIPKINKNIQNKLKGASNGK